MRCRTEFKSWWCRDADESGRAHMLGNMHSAEALRRGRLPSRALVEKTLSAVVRVRQHHGRESRHVDRAAARM